MSVAGQVIAQVRGLIEEASSVLHRKDTEQDERMDALEARIAALETGAPDESITAPAKRGPGRPRKTVAQAGTAEGTASASSVRGEASSA